VFVVSADMRCAGLGCRNLQGFTPAQLLVWRFFYALTLVGGCDHVRFLLQQQTALLSFRLFLRQVVVAPVAFVLSAAFGIACCVCAPLWGWRDYAVGCFSFW
jgi:hypothetical protein